MAKPDRIIETNTIQKEGLLKRPITSVSSLIDWTDTTGIQDVFDFWEEVDGRSALRQKNPRSNIRRWPLLLQV